MSAAAFAAADVSGLFAEELLSWVGLYQQQQQNWNGGDSNMIEEKSLRTSVKTYESSL